MKKKSKYNAFDILLHAFFCMLTLCYIIPLLLVLAASFTRESDLTLNGFRLIPETITLEAYRSAFGNATRMVKAYGITIAQAFLGTFLSCVVAGMVAYPLSRSHFRFKNVITGFIFFTMLFSAGTIPGYIVFSNYYKITNKFIVYILPGITGGAWNTLIFRTFFKGIPESLFESAYLDGAKELTIFFKIVVPLSKPVFASIGFLTLVGRWNDYHTSLIYIRNENLYTLQYLLQRMMEEAEFLAQLAKMGVEM